MDGAGFSRTQAVESAVKDWTRRLVGLDGRNRMLYFRELLRGTLELSAAGDGRRGREVVRLLTAGPVALSEVFAPEALADAARRTRAIAAKSVSNFEEKGIATLYVAHSFATWNRPAGRPPRAPVVMMPLRIELLGPGGGDAVLTAMGPPELNPAFVYSIQRDMGFHPYPEPDERSDDPLGWPDQVRRICGDIAGFALDDRVFVANLEFSKLPMVVDMERNLSALVDNDIVAAIAGDEAARATLKRELVIKADLPDHTPPLDEFLVCDADASQNYAVVAALRHRSIAIHGPPGTGKSQTIANLISSFAAQGLSVLFVSEKRAAIGAVTRRLEAAGCGQLVLDLHDGSGRRHVAQSLGQSIEAIGTALANKSVTPHSELEFSRMQLVAHKHQIHKIREPFGLSFFDLQVMLGTHEGEDTGLRVPPKFLSRWTDAGRIEVRHLMNQWRDAVDQLDEDPTEMWSSSKIQSPDDAAQAKADISELVTTLTPALEGAYRATLAELSVSPENDLTFTEFSEFVTTVSELAGRYELAFAENAARIAQALRPAARSRFGRLLARLFDSAYRKAIQDLPSFGIVDGDAPEVLRDASRLTNAQASWAAWYPDRPAPHRIATGPAFATALHEYREARRRMIIWAPALGRIGDPAEEQQLLRAMLEQRHHADARAELARVGTALADYGLEALVRWLATRGDEYRDLGDTAMRIFAVSAIDAIAEREPELLSFDGTHHQQVADRFAQLDGRHLQMTAQRVMKKVAERAAIVMEQEPVQTKLVQHEVTARGHLMPVRQLIDHAPAVVKALRPCWAMSPLLVSRMLPATGNLFDVVIIDEASQVAPVDAIPAIARAGQVVVSGDPLQLAPTEFTASDSLDDEADREQASASAAPAVNSESILDVMRDLLIERRLVWHYRSQDERLINFSNTHVYENALVSFPGTNQGTWVRHVLAEGVPDTSEGVSSNPAVVNKVVELILHHAAQNPDESLGVIATGTRHARDITESLRIARATSAMDFHGFFEDKGAEPFFIKTMDMAQGDERDHVIFSVGYGRNPHGDMVYRWGLLTRRGGERRLNVAVTRSKRRMTVVSSMRSTEIDSTKTRSAGAALLAEYLDYAERGGSIPGNDEAEPLSAFEESVCDRLEAAGIPIQPRYGVGSLRIDFAAFESDDMQRPVLAIESDGIGYRTTETVRDRDRLRREVLLRRGWQFHRIWSIDWYRDPGGQTAKAVEAWHRAVQRGRGASLVRRAGASQEHRPIVAGRGRSPIAVRRGGILAYRRDELVQLVRWIQSDGFSRTDDQILVEAMDVLGVTDSGGRASRALRGAIEEAHR